MEQRNVSRAEGLSRNRQGHGLCKPLAARQTNQAAGGDLDMLIAKAAPTLAEFSKLRMFAAVRYQIANNHVTLFSHNILLGLIIYENWPNQ